MWDARIVSDLLQLPSTELWAEAADKALDSLTLRVLFVLQQLCVLAGLPRAGRAAGLRSLLSLCGANRGAWIPPGPDCCTSRGPGKAFSRAACAALQTI